MLLGSSVCYTGKRDKAELIEQSMEVFLALLVTASQACCFPFLDVSKRLEVDEELGDTCTGVAFFASLSMCIHFSICALLGQG